MASEVVCGLIFRLLLPICLKLKFLVVICPPGHTGRLLMSLCFSSLSFLLFHIIYQITVNSLLAGNNIDRAFNCSTWEKSIRQIGFESVIGADAGNGIRVFLPDIGMFLAGLACWLLCRSLFQKRPPEDMAQDNTDYEPEGEVKEEEEMEEEEGEDDEEEEESNKMKILRHIAGVASKVKEIIGNLITTAGKVVVTILLGVTGITLPSLTSAVYFFVFLFLCTWWSFCRTFDTLIFSCMCVLMAIFSAGHLVVLYLYQFQFFQESIPPEDSYISLFGISSIIQTDCSSTWRMIVNPDLAWHHFVNPIMLLLLYYTLATLIRLWLQEPIEVGNTLATLIHLWLQEPIEVGNTLATLIHLWLQEPNLGLAAKSNGTSCDISTLNSVENRPVGLDLYSTPQYKMDQTNNITGEFYCTEEEKEEQGDEEEEEEKEGRVNAVVTVFRFIMKQSYICALIAMMAWSITYVSWLTFVFLMWSCMLWMVRDRRRYTMLTSPFMVLYGNLLIVLQYIWSFELLEPVPGLFLKKDVPFSELGSKVLCLLSFWLLLRQTLTERKDKQREEDAVLTDVHVDDQPKKKVVHQVEPITYYLLSVWVTLIIEEEEDEEGGEQDIMQVLGNMVMEMLVKYWIYICGGMFFFVSFEGRMVMYKIIYMMLLLFCVALYQVHYEYWRRILKYFWMSVVVYTMLTSLPFWSNMTGMSVLKDLGLEQFSVSMLFTRIFIPTSFLLVCILHLHYFHDRFLLLTDLKAVAQKQDSTIYSHAKVNGHLKNKWHLVVDRLTVLFLKFLEYFHKLQLFIWWLLEIHIIKIVSSYIILVSVKEVSLFNYVFMACWAFALPFSQFRPLASSICTVWTCVIIVCKMLYQLESIQPASYSKNCSMPMNYTEKQREEMKDSLLYKEPVDPSNWVGLNKFNPLLENLRNNLLMLAVLAFEVTIYRHQQYYRLRNKLTAPAARIIFHDITRQHLDNGIVNCAKYFINYFFYKFGLETCFLLAVNVIGQRMDFYAVLHAFSLIAVMYRRRRKAIAEIWPKYCCFQACILTWQYFVCIGIPPAACKDYPWRFPNSAMDSNVIKWLYFPDFHTNPNPIFLVYDFMLLLCASLQRSVFDEENKAAVRLMAGDNVEICRDLDAASFSVHNPVPDFIHCRSYLDMLKVIMFSYLFWFVLTIIFITGTTRISLFCLGYLVGCFYFLLFGGELLLKPIKKILHYWDFLIAYNVFVITMKNILSILACGYINVLVVNNCWLIQLLSLACTIKEYKKCDLPSDEAGIIWDSICFAFLLLQRRVFMSYYFLHVVADIRASQILASRGAELFQATIVKAVRARLEEENKSMEQLKRQMDRIKQRQEKFKSGKKKMLSLAQESGDRENPIQEKVKVKETAKTKKRQWWRPWVDHASMVRSGDYYLFETDSEEEEEEEEKREDQELPKKSAFQFFYHAWITDSKTAMKERGKEKRKFWKRYTKRDKHKKDKKEGKLRDIILVECPDATLDKIVCKKNLKIFVTSLSYVPPDNVLKRVFNIIKFTWVLFQTTVESFTKWMNNVCREHIDISTVLRIERCMLTREVKKGNVPSRESIHVFYQKQMRMSMSRGSSLDRLSEEDSASGGSHRSQDSMASLASRDSISSAYTEATMLFSRQDTLDELDGMPSDVPIPKTSERARPKLRKIYGLDASKSTDSSSSQVSSETTQCITLYSRQGTTDTIEEVEDEQDQGENRLHGPWEHPPPEGSEGAEDSPWLLYTPDTDAPNTSDADVPPSYSKAVSFDRLEVSEDESDRDDNRMMAMTPDTSRSDYLDDPLLPSLTTELTASELLLNKMFHDEELERSERFYVGQPLVLQLVYALYNMLVAHSEMVCYLVIILNNMLSASCVTLVLPILIFLWAMLSVPRPSKRFWMTAIVYTEVTIVIKYFFQFGFFPFNQNPKVDVNKPYHPPNIIGVEKKDGYVVYDLIQLLALFFHRSILKCHGLWDEDNLKDTKKEILRRDTESEDDERREMEATPVPSTPRERKGSTQTLRSINLGMGTSVDSVHVPNLQQQQQTYQRRKSSSGGSHISHRSVHSVRSKRGSTNSRNSSHRDGSESVQQKTKKQLIKEKLREQMIKAKTFTIKRTMEVYLPIRQFFYNLVHPEYSAVTDVYVLMFLADTVDFIIIVFGFSAFGKHSAGADITSSLSEDQVPGAFLVMVLIQFGTMVVDRALYLKKTVLGKVIFQVILVFGIHFWMFFILPGLSDRRFNENTVAKLWYCIKCIYFGLSAYQIRCGYPTRVLGNFLTKSYNYANLFLFQGFRLIPFLTELRAVMDWVWTDTSLSLSSWICVEDIYAHIFILKCWRESERRYPQPRGQAKKPVVKYGMGGMIVMLLICIIWFPLLFMSLVKSVVGVVNKPLDVSFSITLAGFQPIFTMSAQQNQLREVSNHEFHNTFMRSYLSDPEAMQWLESYMPEDLTIAELEGSSNSLWTISPPSRTNIMKMLSSKEQFPITVAWSVQRNPTLGAKAEFSTGKKMLVTACCNSSVARVIKHGFQRYLRAPTDSEAKPIEQLSTEEVSITLALERLHNDSEGVQEWWIVNQTSPGKINVRSPKNLYNAGLELYVFSDQVSPPSLGFLAGYGIMGLYASVVLVIGKFVREFFSGISHTIMFEELPNVDRILKLCTDIFLVRETGELDLEEDMYAKLIFLYRSPETMIKWTREKTQ
uniref:Piezo-type mechanosensitive ion channel component n=1 Tax=Oncorhynchus tshawytscha TaxID=74940 RepID=A0AAZ3R3X8_ONCTS